MEIKFGFDVTVVMYMLEKMHLMYVQYVLILEALWK